MGRSSSNGGRGVTRSVSPRPVNTLLVPPTSSFTDDEKPSIVPVSSSTFVWGKPKEIEKPKEEIIVEKVVDVIKQDIKIIEKVEEPIVVDEIVEKGVISTPNVSTIPKQTGSAWGKGPTLAEKLIIQEEVKKNPLPVVVPVVEETPVVEQVTDKKVRKSRGRGGAGTRKVSDDIVVPTKIDTIAAVVEEIVIQEEVVKVQEEVVIAPIEEKIVEVIQEPIFVAEPVVPVVENVQSPNRANIIQEKLNPSSPKVYLKMGRWAAPEQASGGDGILFGSFNHFGSEEQPSGSSAWGGVTESNDNQHTSESTWSNGSTVESTKSNVSSISLGDIKSISAPSNQSSFVNKSAGPPPGLEAPSQHKQNQQQNRGTTGQRSNKHDQNNFQQQQYQQYNNSQIGGQMPSGRGNTQQPNMVYGNSYPPGLDQSYIQQQPNSNASNAYPSTQTTSMHTSPTTTAPIVAGSGPTSTNTNIPPQNQHQQQQQQYGPPGMPQTPYGYYPQQNPYYPNQQYYYQNQVPQNFGYNQGGRGGYSHPRPYGSDPYNSGQSSYPDQGYGQGGFGMDGMPVGSSPQVGGVGTSGKGNAKGNAPTGGQQNTGSTTGGSQIPQDGQQNTQNNNYGYGGYNTRGDQQQSWQYQQNPSQGNWPNPMMGFPVSNSPIGGGGAPFSQQPGGNQNHGNQNQGNQNQPGRGSEQPRGNNNAGGNSYNSGSSSFNNQRNGSQQQANNFYQYSGGATSNP
jgi:hypothetical protein